MFGQQDHLLKRGKTFPLKDVLIIDIKLYLVMRFQFEIMFKMIKNYIDTFALKTLILQLIITSFKMIMNKHFCSLCN